MPNDSSTGGFLSPSNSITYDSDLEDIVQAVVVGITGIAANLVRPRFQPEPGNLPDFGTNWIALGISVTDQDTFAYQVHDPNAATYGANWVERDEQLELFFSFYGPNCSDVMSRWREGISIEQNRWALYDSGIKLVEPGKAIYLPALLKERWTKRVDLKTIMNRRIHRLYPIREVAQVTLTISNPITTTLVINP